ncbi:hypothetical protein XarbCFBP8138_18910 [Xanthomonas arboricola]|nr:hypothetical protein XarbCFBP8138_18910 [Xanthomonas arboricola]
MRVASPLAGPYAAWMPRPRKNLHGRTRSVSRDGRRARPPAASLQISRPTTDASAAFDQLSS